MLANAASSTRIRSGNDHPEGSGKNRRFLVAKDYSSPGFYLRGGSALSRFD